MNYENLDYENLDYENLDYENLDYENLDYENLDYENLNLKLNLNFSLYIDLPSILISPIMSSLNVSKNIWYFRDDMLESGSEMDTEYLKEWLSYLINQKTYLASILYWIIGIQNTNKNLLYNSLLISLLEKIKPTSENNRVLDKFYIKIE